MRTSSLEYEQETADVKIVRCRAGACASVRPDALNRRADAQSVGALGRSRSWRIGALYRWLLSSCPDCYHTEPNPDRSRAYRLMRSRSSPLPRCTSRLCSFSCRIASGCGYLRRLSRGSVAQPASSTIAGAEANELCCIHRNSTSGEQRWRHGCR